MKRPFLTGLICLSTIFVYSTPTLACSKVLWQSKSGPEVIVGRNMDWLEDTRSNLWLFPRGMTRDGAVPENPLKWTSKYGSVGLSIYDIGTVDGINERGLSMSMLYLTESKFGKRDPKVPGLSVTLWGQYFLDNFATVQEAVESLKTNPFQVAQVDVETSAGKKEGTVHLSISDNTGDSVVLEYINGKLQTYHNKDFIVMTNSPTYDKQLEIIRQYKGFGGSKALPGTTEAADRFVRAAYYTSHLPDTKDYREAVAGVFSVMRNVSQPFGVSDPARPNISPTRWRTVADLTKRIYYYENTESPNLVWVELEKLNFDKKQKTKKIDLVKNYSLIGNISDKFKEVSPMKFLATGSPMPAASESKTE